MKSRAVGSVLPGHDPSPRLDAQPAGHSVAISVTSWGVAVLVFKAPPLRLMSPRARR